MASEPGDEHDITSRRHADGDQSGHNQKNQVGTSPGLSMIKALPCPGPIVFPHVTHNSLTLAWKAQEGQSKPQKFRVTWANNKKKSEARSIETEFSATELRIQGLGPGQTYDFTVAGVNDRGELGPSASATKTMDFPAPKGLTVKRMETSAHLSWTLAPEMEGTPHSFLISCRSSEAEHTPIIISTTSCSAVVTGLQPHTEYTAFVKLVGESGREVSSAACTIPAVLLPPGPIDCKMLIPTSMSLSWLPPRGGLTGGQKYCVTWRSERLGDQHRTVTPVTQLEVQNLHPGDTYKFTVSTISESGEESLSVSVSHYVDVPAPEKLTVKRTETSADLSWTAPSSMAHIPHTFLVSYHCEAESARFISTASCNAVITGLQPHTEYDVNVCVVCENGTESRPVSKKIHTGEDLDTLRVKSLSPTSVEVSWTPSEEMNQIARSFQISYVCEETEHKTFSTDSSRAVIKDLKPDSKYLFSVSAPSESAHGTELGPIIFCTDVPAPGPIQIRSATPTSITLMWKSLGGRYGYSITRKCPKYQATFTVWDSGLTVQDLNPKDLLDITVVTLGKDKRQSSTGSTLQYRGMEIPQPTNIQVYGNTVKWRKPAVLDSVSYLLTVNKQGAVMFNVISENTQCTLPEGALQPGFCYVIFVSTVLGSAQSIPNIVAIDENGTVTPTDQETYSTDSQATPTAHFAVKSRQYGKSPSTNSSQQPSSASRCVPPVPKVELSLPDLTGSSRPLLLDPTHRIKNKKKYYLHATGKAKSYCSEIQNLWLQGLSEVKSVDRSDMILAICMVVSRVGTDVEATLREITVNKPTVLVVMHHTFDPAYVVPDSRRYAKDGMLVVDCVFYEDQGLLRCETNDKAQSTVLNWIERKIVGTQPKGTSHVNESSRFYDSDGQ